MRIRFRDLELDEGRLLLCRQGRRVSIRPKVFDLLVHLVTHRERVVLREELVLKLWGTTAVGPGSLAGLVNELRQILGEPGRGPSSIRTVHARGYQFVAPVEDLERAVEVPRRSTPGLALASRPSPQALAVDPDREAVVDLVGRRIARIDSKGAQAVILDGSPDSEWAALLDHGSRGIRRAGFEIHRLAPPVASASRSRDLVTRIFESLIEHYGIDELRAAIPGRTAALHARAERRARGHSVPSRDPLVARQIEEEAWRGIAELLRAITRQRAVALVIEAIDGSGAEAGSRWIAFLLRVIGRRRFFLLGARTQGTGPGVGSGFRGEGAEIEDVDSRVAVLRVTALNERDSETRFDPPPASPLPAELTVALMAHVRREPARLRALVLWLESEHAKTMGRKRETEGTGDPVHAADPAEAGEPVREPRMRRVEPGGARPRSQASGRR